MEHEYHPAIQISTVAPFAQQQGHLTKSIMRPSPHSVTGIFDSSPCPEPSPLAFVAFTILSTVWVFCQLCLSSSSSPATPQPHSENESNNKSLASTERIIASLLYATICGVLLLNGCWLATIYVWAIKQLYKGTSHGILGFAFTALVLAVHFIFLLAGFALWVWGLLVTLCRLCKLWIYRGDTFGELDRTGTCKNIESK